MCPKPSTARRGEFQLLEMEKIRELIQLMVENELAEVSIKDGEHEIELKRGGETVVSHVAPVVAHPAPPPAHAPAPAGPPAPAGEEKDTHDGLVPIISPMVGTFYSAPDPNSPPYVTVGSEITEDTLVCLIEAMKVFNEIKAEVAGTLEKILVSNEEGVDYGQHLYLVRPRS